MDLSQIIQNHIPREAEALILNMRSVEDMTDAVITEIQKRIQSTVYIPRFALTPADFAEWEYRWSPETLYAADYKPVEQHIVLRPHLLSPNEAALQGICAWMKLMVGSLSKENPHGWSLAPYKRFVLTGHYNGIVTRPYITLCSTNSTSPYPLVVLHVFGEEKEEEVLDYVKQWLYGTGKPGRVELVIVARTVERDRPKFEDTWVTEIDCTRFNSPKDLGNEIVNREKKGTENSIMGRFVSSVRLMSRKNCSANQTTLPGLPFYQFTCPKLYKEQGRFFDLSFDGAPYVEADGSFHLDNSEIPFPHEEYERLVFEGILKSLEGRAHRFAKRLLENRPKRT